MQNTEGVVLNVASQVITWQSFSVKGRRSTPEKSASRKVSLATKGLVHRELHGTCGTCFFVFQKIAVKAHL